MLVLFYRQESGPSGLLTHIPSKKRKVQPVHEYRFSSRVTWLVSGRSKVGILAFEDSSYSCTVLFLVSEGPFQEDLQKKGSSVGRMAVCLCLHRQAPFLPCLLWTLQQAAAQRHRGAEQATTLKQHGCRYLSRQKIVGAWTSPLTPACFPAQHDWAVCSSASWRDSGRKAGTPESC